MLNNSTIFTTNISFIEMARINPNLFAEKVVLGLNLLGIDYLQLLSLQLRF